MVSNPGEHYSTILLERVFEGTKVVFRLIIRREYQGSTRSQITSPHPPNTHTQKIHTAHLSEPINERLLKNE